jgi:hypothetical protein
VCSQLPYLWNSAPLLAHLLFPRPHIIIHLRILRPQVWIAQNLQIKRKNYSVSPPAIYSPHYLSYRPLSHNSPCLSEGAASLALPRGRPVLRFFSPRRCNGSYKLLRAWFGALCFSIPLSAPPSHLLYPSSAPRCFLIPQVGFVLPPVLFSLCGTLLSSRYYGCSPLHL